MAQFPGFIGASYTARSSNADCQRTLNLYPEIVESGAGKNKLHLLARPGLAVVATLPQTPLRCLYSGDGDRVFAVAGRKLYEVFADGTYTELGDVGTASTPAQIFSNGDQLFIVSGNKAYITGGGPVFPITDAAVGGYVDGYFIALNPSSQRFYISNLKDGSTWDPLDFGEAEGSPDHAVSVLVDKRQLWLFGQRSTEGFWNSGNSDFPFERMQNGFIEEGCGAAYSPVVLKNAPHWIGGSHRGGRVAYRADGYTPVRISNHAVEAAWNSYSTIADAEGFPYEEEGHSLWQLRFPTADKTWVYDATMPPELAWTERCWWDATRGIERPHRARVHCYAWDKHLVGDWESGKIYRQSLDLLDDAGDVIRRLRRAPHISEELNLQRFPFFQLDLEVGVAPDGTDPQLMLRYSNNGGKTWSNELWESAGLTGDHDWQVIWYRLGAGRDRVFEVVQTDRVKTAWTNAYLGRGVGAR